MVDVVDVRKKRVVVADGPSAMSWKDAEKDIKIDFKIPFEDRPPIEFEEGEVSIETLLFNVTKPVANLRRTDKLLKAGKKCVETAETDLGKYAPQDEPYAFMFDEVAVPSGFFAKGDYVVSSTYSDAGAGDAVLLETKLKIKVVKKRK